MSPVNVSPQGNILYSPATPGLSPMITIQPPGDLEASDQPTDLSMKSPREENKEQEQEKSENPEAESTLDLQELDSNQDQEMLDDQEKLARSPKQSFQESFLNLKQKDPATVSTTSSSRASPVEDENPFGSVIADDVFMNGAGSDDKDVDKGENTEEDTGTCT